MRFILYIFLLSSLLLSDSNTNRKGLFFDIGVGGGYNFYQDADNNQNFIITSKVGYGFNNQWIGFIDYPTLYSSVETEFDKKDFDNDFLMFGVKYLPYDKNTPYLSLSIGKNFSEIDNNKYKNNFGESWSIESGYEFSSYRPWYFGLKYIETKHNQIDYQSINFVIGGTVYGAFGVK